MTKSSTYTATCFCGSVELELTGEPVFQGFCHCDSCKRWLGAPMNAATLWPIASVRFRKGEDLLGTFAKAPRSQRKHCTQCGGSVLNAHYDEGVSDVLASLIKDFPFAPTMHVHYRERLLDARDDLPKFSDLPIELGGTGELVE
ncbi:MAG TPA: GFA family protein [Gammaproteobacteria bacterium]